MRYNEEFKQWIIDTFTTPSGRVKAHLQKKFPEELKKVYENTPNLNGLSDTLRIRCILLDIDTIPVCQNPNCSNHTSFDNKSKQFSKYCSNKCAYNDPEHKDNISKTKKGGWESGKYTAWNKGLTKEDDKRIANAIEKQIETKKEKYESGELQPWNKGLYKDTDERVKKFADTYRNKSKEEKSAINEKRKQTVQKTYGVDNIFQSEEIKEKSKQTMLDKYGYDYVGKVPELRKIIEQTNLNRYGVKSVLEKEEVYMKGQLSILKKYGCYFPETEKYKEQKDKIFDKMRQTNLEKYGYEIASKNKDVSKKRIETLREKYGVDSVALIEGVQNKRRRTFKENTLSKRKAAYPNLTEEELFLLEEEYRKEVAFYTEVSVRMYNEYINKHNYIRGENFHVDHRYSILQGFIDGIDPIIISSPGNLEVISSSDNQSKRDKCSIKMQQAINETHDIFSHTNTERKLDVTYPFSQLQQEYIKYVNANSKYNASIDSNKIILHYQSHFYEKEKIKWEDDIIRGKLLWNRYIYKRLFPFELKDTDILRGFKISGIHYGFSHFSPLWIKAFIEEFDVKSVYDPCGGWGHRLLGAQLLDKYIYNDVDERTVKGVQDMINDFKVENTIVYNEKAENFAPKENYDAVFTCPPYWNTEKYNHNQTSTQLYPTYDIWLNEWWRNVIKKSLKNSVKYFAFVTSPKLKDDMGATVESFGLTKIKEQELGIGTKSHFQEKRYHKDVLLVYTP